MLSELKIKQLEFATSQEAWEGINELFINADPSIFGENNGSILSSGTAIAYNMVINIRKSWMDPEFDLGKIFNYQQTKWTLLINNYVNLNKLDLVRSQVRSFENKRARNYNVSFTFDNNHTNGKGCLIACSFCKRIDMDVPIIIANLRSSEITKRLAFDLVLLQRLGEYVFGEDSTVMVQLNCNQMYNNKEVLCTYHIHKPLKSFMDEKSKRHKWTQEVYNTYLHFKKVDPKTIKFKVFRRVIACLRPGDIPEKKNQTLKVNQLLLSYDNIPYPEDCINYTQRQKFKKKYLYELKKNKQ